MYSATKSQVLNLLRAGVLLLLTVTLPSPAVYVPFPKGWTSTNNKPDEVNGSRALIGQLGNLLLMNLTPTTDSGLPGRGRLPVFYDLNKNTYALLLEGQPLKWLKPDQPVKEQLSDDQITQISVTICDAYDFQGGHITGLYAKTSSDGKTFEKVGAFKSTLPEDNGKDTFSIDVMPDSNGATNASEGIGQRISNDGHIIFGIQIPTSNSGKSHQGIFPRDEFFTQLSTIGVGAPNDNYSPKDYYFWVQQSNGSYKIVKVNFAKDPYAEIMIQSGNASLMQVSASADMHTVAMNLVAHDFSAGPESLAGTITLDSDKSSAEWERLPADATSQVLTLTLDGKTALVKRGSTLYQLPTAIMNNMFSDSTAGQYQLEKEASDYLVEGLFQSGASPSWTPYAIQQFNGTNDPFSGLLTYAKASAIAFTNERKVIAPIPALLALSSNSTATNSQLPPVGSNAAPNYTAFGPGPNSQTNHFAVTGDDGASDAPGFFWDKLPARPAVPAMPLLPAMQQTGEKFQQMRLSPPPPAYYEEKVVNYPEMPPLVPTDEYRPVVGPATGSSTGVVHHRRTTKWHKVFHCITGSPTKQ